jgi:hydrogenase expression/formation protein HypD
LALIDKYLQPVDVAWREIGVLAQSGLGLRAEYRAFDASERFSLSFASAPTTPTRCRCGDVLKGKIGPSECELFGRACVPDRPIGPCMVSAEGSCAAEYKYSALAQRAGAA